MYSNLRPLDTAITWWRKKEWGWRLLIFGTIVAGLGFGHWAWHTWMINDAHVVEKERHRAKEMCNMLASVLNILDQNKLRVSETERQILNDILYASAYDFIVVKRTGAPMLRIGDAPEDLTSLNTAPYRLSAHRFEIRCHAQSPKARSASAPVIWLGGEIGKGGGYERVLWRVVTTFTVAFLLVLGVAAAWILTARNRLLAARLRSKQDRLAHLEDLGLAAAGLAHETKNPLGIVSGLAWQILKEPGISTASREMLESIIDEVDKSASRLGNFITFAGRREIRQVPVALHDVLKGTVELLRPEFDLTGVQVMVTCPDVTVRGDEETLRQILVNLLLNSLQASPANTRVVVRLQSFGNQAALSVEDQGNGISAELLPDIFKPYVSGRTGGHGLGLAIVKRFAEENGWTVAAESQQNEGTRITISGISLLAATDQKTSEKE